MSTESVASDVTGNVLSVGDAVLYSSSSSAALIVGHIINIRERYMSITPIHVDESSGHGIDTRKPHQVVKLVGLEYENAPTEWLRIMFPTVK